MVCETPLAYKEIGSKLNIEARTVRFHMAHVYNYFEIAHRNGAASRLAVALKWNEHRFQLRDWQSYLAWHRRKQK